VKTQPIRTARIELGTDADAEPPFAPDFGDLYHPRIGAQAQAQHVFLHGNGLPARWAGRERFVIVETGFGLGNNFLATWAAWRQDPLRCERLHYVAVERHPPALRDLARAHAHSALPDLAAQLLQQWPALTPNLHPIDFDGGRVQLLLCLGDVAALLPALRVQADAFYLDGFAPARNAEMWQPRVLKALARMAAEGATLATWSVARELQSGLTTAGFDVMRAPGIGGKREITTAQHAPRHAARLLPALAVASPHAMVVGAGVAGAAVAQALARQGLRVTVFEREERPATQGSGNPAGIFHGSAHEQDGPHARLLRAGALLAQREVGAALASGLVRGSATGLLRVEGRPRAAAEMREALARWGLPPEYLRVLDADAATALAGVPLPAAWHYPGGGAVEPRAWVRLALATPGVQLSTGASIARIERDAGAWRLIDAQGREVARSPLVVLANAEGAAPLLAALGHAPWPLRRTSGQVTFWTSEDTPPLKLPVVGDGYALPLPGGGLVCGATRREGEGEPGVCMADHLHNLQRLQRLTGLAAPPDPAHWRGRAGWRLYSADRMPIAGALPLLRMPHDQRLDQARLLPREPGLFVLTALGSRGLTLAPLLARLVAAQATGTPWPLEQDLADAVDPARWLVRAARHAAARGAEPQPAG
jgi:tRNA 5-methylaminomethyl-2-thiouridine biosynthesis bifunctional protein